LCVAVQAMQHRLLAGGHELAPDALDVDHAVAMLDVDANPRIRRHGENGRVARMRNVEVHACALDQRAPAATTQDDHLGGIGNPAQPRTALRCARGPPSAPRYQSTKC